MIWKLVISGNPKWQPDPAGPIFGAVVSFFAGLSTHDIFKAVFLGVIGGLAGYLGQSLGKWILRKFSKKKEPYK